MFRMQHETMFLRIDDVGLTCLTSFPAEEIPHVVSVVLHCALLFGAPFGAFVLSRVFPRFPAVLKIRLICVLLACIACAPLVTLTPYSFIAYGPEAAALALAWCSACCLAALAFSRTAGSRRALQCIGSILTILLILYCSFHAWNRRPNWDLPVSESSLGDHLILRRDEGGFAGIDWEGITIVQRFPATPFLQKTLYAIRTGDTEDCDENQVLVTPDPSKREVLVQCGLRHPYTWAHVKMP